VIIMSVMSVMSVIGGKQTDHRENHDQGAANRVEKAVPARIGGNFLTVGHVYPYLSSSALSADLVALYLVRV
jgi:hypothetical protein